MNDFRWKTIGDPQARKHPEPEWHVNCRCVAAPDTRSRWAKFRGRVSLKLWRIWRAVVS
jgi:hypothetical protein